MMTPFEGAVRGSLEGSRGGRFFVCRTRRRRPRRPRYTTIGDSTADAPAWASTSAWSRDELTQMSNLYAVAIV